MDDGRANNRIEIGQENATKSNAYLVEGGSQNTAFTGETITANERVKIAFGFKQNDTTFASQGNLQTTDTSSTLGTGITTVNIGQAFDGSRLYGIITTLKYFPIRLVNTKLESMTT